VKVYTLEREQWVPASLDRAFDYFCDAANLERITPPWLGFRILSPLPVEMCAGARIDYRIRLGGVPARWITRITRWDPPRAFVDLQERGPYALWEHLHEFAPLGSGVLMRDRVRYALPFGYLGRAAHRSLIRSLLARIFDYRFAVIREQFGGMGDDDSGNRRVADTGQAPGLGPAGASGPSAVPRRAPRLRREQ
jgi:ligand-binding SRPBCC domain-containing protein